MGPSSFLLYIDLYLCKYDQFVFWLLMIVVGRVGVPRQLVITKDPLSVPDEVNKAGLKLPLGIPSQLMHFCIYM